MLRELEWCSIMYRVYMGSKHRDLVSNTSIYTSILMEAGLELRLGQKWLEQNRGPGPYSTKYGNTNIISTSSKLGLVH